MKINNLKGTSKRKYYLHRQLKKQGFGLYVGDKNRIITAILDLAESANWNKSVAELQNVLSSGVQFFIPIA